MLSITYLKAYSQISDIGRSQKLKKLNFLHLSQFQGLRCLGELLILILHFKRKSISNCFSVQLCDFDNFMTGKHPNFLIWVYDYSFKIWLLKSRLVQAKMSICRSLVPYSFGSPGIIIMLNPLQWHSVGFWHLGKEVKLAPLFLIFSRKFPK